jgi:hypothetical protein
MNDTARDARSHFKTCVRTSEVIYGQGEIYLCDNDCVVKLRDADFDVRNLRLEDDSDCAEFWFSQGVVIAVGGTTSLQEVVTALQMTLKKMQQQLDKKNAASGGG